LKKYVIKRELKTGSDEQMCVLIVFLVNCMDYMFYVVLFEYF